MLFEVCKRFTAAGVSVQPGDIVDTSYWRNTDVLKKHRYIRETDKTEINVKSLETKPEKPKAEAKPVAKKKILKKRSTATASLKKKPIKKRSKV